MTLRPGKLLLAGMIMLVVFAGLAFVTPSAFWCMGALLGVLTGGIAIDLLLLLKAMGKVSVARYAPSVVGRGRTFIVNLELSSGVNDTWNGVVRDIVPAAATQQLNAFSVTLQPGQHQVSYPLVITERGSHAFGSIWLRLIGKLGLVELHKSWDAPLNLRVLPESLVPDEELLKDAMDERRLLDQISTSRNRGAGTEFESLSEYREGDDIRRISWRSSARLNRLIVCRYQLEQHRDVVVLVDCGRLMGTLVNNGTKLDCAVNAALVIARVALRSGDRCGLGIFDSKVRGYLSPVSGAASHRILIDHLYNVKPGWVETNFAPMFATLQARQSKRALLIILSDMMEMETTERYRAALTSLSGRHEVLFAALRTPLLSHSSVAPVNETKDVARKAFAFRLMREREQTLHTLKHRGIHVVDVEPNQLTIPLINTFIDVRQRSVV